jgi:hypothetical protein
VLLLLRSDTERAWPRLGAMLEFVATECLRTLLVAAVEDFERSSGSTSIVSGYGPPETRPEAGEEDGGSKMLSRRTAFSSSSSFVMVKSAV